MKEISIRAKSNIKTSHQRNIDFSQENYYHRIESRYKEAEKAKMVSRLLEQEEATLISKLQQTYNRERQVVEQLSDKKAPQ
mmetsp:Transcript_40321/g.61524  ORF Transcript_40321/g.61524 Transcript_40321/m.61524 type:complete len:81 (+) Transcript_40321:92-334(+)